MKNEHYKIIIFLVKEILDSIRRQNYDIAREKTEVLHDTIIDLKNENKD